MAKLKYLCKSFTTPIIQSELELEPKEGLFPVYGASGLAGYNKKYAIDENYLGIVKDGAGVGRIRMYPEHSSLLGTLAYIVPNEKTDIRWLKYAIDAMSLGERIDSTTIPHIYFSEYGNRYVCDFDIGKQKSIADYLDQQCAHIDAVIEKTKASIEEYKKLKQAVITQAVTKGIRGDRPMKDSGIEWIGEIPADWDVRRIKTLFELRDEKNYLPLEAVNLISLYTDLGVVQHADLEKTTGNKASNADGYKRVFEDDIVVNIILCWMGAIGRSAYEGVTSPAYDIYSPKNNVNSKYYHHYFRTTGFSGDCFQRGRGIMLMRWRTYSDQFRDIKVAYPPIEEQQEIIDFLDKKCVEIDKLILRKEGFLSELESYKKSIIFEYVTGKKEVPQSCQ